MASNVYTQFYSDGTSRRVRRLVKQGRHKSPPELVKVKMEFRTLPATKQALIEKAKMHGMTVSAYIDLAVTLFDIQLSYDKNC